MSHRVAGRERRPAIQRRVDLGFSIDRSPPVGIAGCIGTGIVRKVENVFDPGRTIRISKIIVFPVDRRDNEVILNDAFARANKIYPGMWIHLLLNNRRQELFVVGTAISSEFTYLVGPGSFVPDAKRLGVFYLKQTFAEEVFDFQGACNQVLGRLAPQVRDRPEEVLRRAEILLDSYGVLAAVPLKDQPSNRFLSNEIMGLRAFGVINPAIFLAVAALVLNVLMSRLAEQQRVVVGTLKALGYSRGAIFWHFLKFGLAVGAFSGVTGF